MRTKNIHIIVKYFFPVTAGIETNILQSYSHMIDLGWKIIVHTTRDTLTQSNVLPEKDLVKGIEVIRYKSGIFGFFPKINLLSSDYLCLHNFNVFPHSYIMLASFILKVFNVKKFVLFLTPHGGFTPQWNMFPITIRTLKYLYHKFAGVFLINTTVDGIRAVSVWEQDELVKSGIPKTKIYLIKNGLEEIALIHSLTKVSKNAKSAVTRLGKYIIDIGRIFPIKNYEAVISVLPNLPSDIKLLLVGPVEDQAYKESLLSLANRIGVSDRLIFYGEAHGQDKYYLLRHAQAFVHLAHWESFCNALNEAMSQQIFCIVGNTTALKYLVRDGVTGVTIDPTKIGELQSILTELFSSKKSQKIIRIFKNLRTNKVFTSWSDVAKILDSVFISFN